MIVYEYIDTFEMYRRTRYFTLLIILPFGKYLVEHGQKLQTRTNRNGYYPEDKQILRWVFEVDATSDDSTLGIFNVFTPQLGFKWMTRDYGSGNECGYLHLTQYWDGGGTDQYSQPMIMISTIT